jgi:hypothetical protein
MTFFDGGKAEKAFSSETGLGFANNQATRRAAHFFSKKCLCSGRIALFLPLPNFARACGRVSVWRGSGQEAG